MLPTITTIEPLPVQIVDEDSLGEHLIDLGTDGSIRIQNKERDGQECVILSDGEVARLKAYLSHI